jgi:hypothetical protein
MVARVAQDRCGFSEGHGTESPVFRLGGMADLFAEAKADEIEWLHHSQLLGVVVFDDYLRVAECAAALEIYRANPKARVYVEAGCAVAAFPAGDGKTEESRLAHWVTS